MAKGFKGSNNPALSYMSTAEHETEAVKAEAALSPSGKRLEDMIIELADMNEQQIKAKLDEIRAYMDERGQSAEDEAASRKLYEIGKAIIEKRERDREKKSRRLNLLIKPSVYRDIAALAAAEQTSANDLINTILEAYRDEHTADIKGVK